MSEREDLLGLALECVSEGWDARDNLLHQCYPTEQIVRKVDLYLARRESAKPEPAEVDPVAFETFMRYCREHAINSSCSITPKAELADRSPKPTPVPSDVDLLSSRVSGLENEVKLLLDERCSDMLDNERGPKVEGEPVPQTHCTGSNIVDCIVSMQDEYKKKNGVAAGCLYLGSVEHDALSGEFRLKVSCGKISKFRGMDLIRLQAWSHMSVGGDKGSYDSDPSCERGSM